LVGIPHTPRSVIGPYSFLRIFTLTRLTCHCPFQPWTVFHTHTAQLGVTFWSGTAFVLYSGGARFESPPGHRPSWLRFFIGILIPYRQTSPSGHFCLSICSSVSCDSGYLGGEAPATVWLSIPHSYHHSKQDIWGGGGCAMDSACVCVWRTRHLSLCNCVSGVKVGERWQKLVVGRARAYTDKYNIFPYSLVLNLKIHHF
jgi:hypothetical protein